MATHPELSEEATRYGIDVQQSVDRWEEAVGAAQLNNLLNSDSSPFLIATAINETSQQRDLPLLAYLTAEAVLIRRASTLSGYMRSSGTTLETVLTNMADRLGEAFLGAAFLITWQRRVIFARLLDAARGYLEWTRQAALLADQVPRRGVQTRLAIATVLTARFGPVAETELRDAREMLLDSHQRGSETAFEYYIEASIWLYDLFEDSHALREAAREVKLSANQDHVHSIMAAHLWMRLTGIASRPEGASGFIHLARKALEYQNRWTTSRFQDVTLLLLSAVLDQIEADLDSTDFDISTRGILLPFGHRRPDTPTASLFERSLPRLINALQESSWSGDFMFRDLTATFLSLHARSVSTASGDSMQALRTSIEVRAGKSSDRARPLSRDGIEAEQAADRFMLAKLIGSQEMRRQGFVDLLKGSEPEDLKPRYLTLIAKEIEENGPLGGGFVPGIEEISLAMRNGDASAIFVAAARAAYSSADLTRVLLGGRGEVVTLRDSDGIAGQTFVYKRTRPEAKARDAEYSALVQARISARGLSDRYGLIEHLADIEDLESSGQRSDTIISVRRFSDGVPLMDHLLLQEATSSRATLTNVAKFLALIHFCGLDGMNSDGTRSALKQREVGRWLRALQLSDEERGEAFDRWWSVVSTAPLVPRRDAHPLNWLIGVDDRVRAVDLESRGARPVGYELAQLVEDGQTLDPGDAESRRMVVNSYLEEWMALSQQDHNPYQVYEWYDAGSIARALRSISHPFSSPASRAYGGDLLASVARNTSNSELRDLATSLTVRWNRLKGRVREEGSKPLSEADRRRISRAMSYHLRHDRTAPANRSGWVHVDELAQVMRAAGHRVSSAQLLLIAGALGEQRFQLDGEDIRAAYGHSIPVDISYESRRPPEILYHATPTRNLASIFEARAGLSPGARNWVHLTESCSVALNTARRQAAAVSVLEIQSKALHDLVFAAGTTWLAPVVRVDDIRIVSVRRARDLTRQGSDAIH